MNWTVFWVCIEIFLFRILDVSLGTTRMVLTVKEKPVPASLIGFVEAFVWFTVVRQALTADVGFVTAIAYAAGFASGTFIGGIVARKLIKGNVVLQIVISKNDELITAIQGAGYAVTIVETKGTTFGPEKYMLFCDINKDRLKELKALIHRYDEDAFIMVQENKMVFNGFIK